jgi:hypothetical protein
VSGIRQPGAMRPTAPRWHRPPSHRRGAVVSPGSASAAVAHRIRQVAAVGGRRGRLFLRRKMAARLYQEAYGRPALETAKGPRRSTVRRQRRVARPGEPSMVSAPLGKSPFASHSEGLEACEKKGRRKKAVCLVRGLHPGYRYGVGMVLKRREGAPGICGPKDDRVAAREKLSTRSCRRGRSNPVRRMPRGAAVGPEPP